MKTTRVFNGQRFDLYDGYETKKKADSVAKSLRAKGKHARVTKSRQSKLTKLMNVKSNRGANAPWWDVWVRG